MAKWLLVEDCPWEQAKVRTVVGRSYYSVFLRAWSVIRSIHPWKLDHREPEMHQQVIDALADLGRPDLADKLYSLKQMRVAADYNLLSDLLPVEARKTLQLAKYIYIGLDSV